MTPHEDDQLPRVVLLLYERRETMTKKVKALGEEWKLIRLVNATALIEKDGKRVSIAADQIEPVKAPAKKKAKKAKKTKEEKE